MILAIIQARMGSSRLPGKVMMRIGEAPLIGLMLNRLSNCRKIDKIILATSISKDNDLLAEYVLGQGYTVFRGSEEDVLERFYMAARDYEPEAVVRLTGDCALIDAEIVDALIDLYRNSKIDYAWVDSSFAEGLDAEVMSFHALECAHLEANLASEREHLTQFIHKNSNRFICSPLKNTIDESVYRIVVDNPEDLQVVRLIAEFFAKSKADTYFSFSQIKNFLNANPEIFKINSNIVRNEGLIKSLVNDVRIK